MVGTGTPKSIAVCDVHLPVPFWPAVSRIISTSGPSVSASFFRKTVAVISIRNEFRSPSFHFAKVSDISAGERQKCEILKQLYLKRRFLILDEPTSVLTPREADEVLGMLRDLVIKGELTILMITHKFREVMSFADEVTILRRGKLAGQGKVKTLTPDDMARAMIGAEELTVQPARASAFG